MFIGQRSIARNYRAIIRDTIRIANEFNRPLEEVYQNMEDYNLQIVRNMIHKSVLGLEF